jgi:hypothetical protein
MEVAKMKFNTDNSTNAALAVMIAIEIFEKLTGHPIPSNAKETLLEIFPRGGALVHGKAIGSDRKNLEILWT